MRRALGLALAAASALGATAPASAATITVDTGADAVVADAQCSLREAVSSAGDDSAGPSGCEDGEAAAEDVIVLTPGTTYALTRAGAGEDSNATGDLDLGTGAASAGVAIAASAPGSRPVIDGALTDRILDVDGDGDLRIEGVRLTQGQLAGSNLTDNGGALNWSGSGPGELALRNVLIDGNSAALTAAVYTETEGGVVIEDSVVRDNLTTDGGAVGVSGPLTVTRSSILDNIGGGLVGRLVGPDAVSIDRSTIAGNRFSADTSVGGVFSAGETSVTNTTVTGNVGGFVGGVESHGPLEVSFSTITENGSPEDSGGHRAGGLGAPAGAVLSGVILAGNQSGILPINCNEEQDFQTGSAPNLESGDSCHLGPGNLTGTDPRLAPLADNGGPTQTRGLYPDSPALDFAPACGLGTDQRGVVRGPDCDLGAFEGTVPLPPPPAPPAQEPQVKRKKCRKGMVRKKGRCVKKKKRGKAKRSARALARADEVRVVGRSVGGRRILARRYGPADAERVGLVVGVIHGDERAGLGVIRLLRDMEGELGDSQLWLIDSVNPDGARARTRKNARGVDINRNFPFRWRGGVPRSSGYYPGTRPASEPETRAVMGFIREIEPDVSVWYHQPWGAVLACRGRPALAARYARLAGAPTSCRGRGLRGTAISWENDAIPGGTAFVVELPAAGLRPRAERRHARAAATIVRNG